MLGSAGGPRRALDLIDRDRFLIVNGDTLTDLDLAAPRRRARRAGRPGHDGGGAAARAGYNALRVVRRAPSPGWFRPARVAGAGGGRSALHRRPGGRAARVRATAAGCRRRHRARAVSASSSPATPARSACGSARATFHDVGTPAEYLRTVQTWPRAERRPLDRGAGTTIAPSARVEGSVCWDDVDIGGGAEVHRLRRSPTASGCRRACRCASRACVPAGRRASRPRAAVSSAICSSCPSRFRPPPRVEFRRWPATSTSASATTCGATT